MKKELVDGREEFVMVGVCYYPPCLNRPVLGCENMNESEQKKLKYALRGRLDIEQQQR